jgi:hypothetical protein
MPSHSQGELLPIALGGRADAAGGTTSLMAYLTAALMALRNDPRTVAACLSVAELAAMAWVYLGLRRHYGLRVAVIALVLWAAAPWSVLAARRVSAEALLPLLSSALFVPSPPPCSTRPARWLAAPFLVGLVALTGPGALPLAVTLVVLALLCHRRLAPAPLALGAAIAAAMVLPSLFAGGAATTGAAARGNLWQWLNAAHSGGLMETLTGPDYAD